MNLFYLIMNNSQHFSDVSSNAQVHTFLLDLFLGVEFLGHRLRVYSTLADNLQ